MKNLCGIPVLLISLSAGCGVESSPTPPPSPQEPPTVSETRWSEKTELFLEYPELVVGRNARFAIHLTNLNTFEPLTQGRATVELLQDGRRIEEFATEAPSRPGIFGVDVAPTQAGRYTMAIRVVAEDLEDVHTLEGVRVYADLSEVPAPGPEEPSDAISFLKEQQWTLDFRTVPVTEQVLRESIFVPGEVWPRTGGEVEVTAPFGGRLGQAVTLPTVGTAVEQKQVLASLLPKTSSPAERATLEFAVAEAEAQLALARKETRRVGRLLEVGAIPARRLEEAQTTETTLEAKLKAAKARLAYLQVWQDADREATHDGQFLVRSPISGVVAEARATAGATVEQGEILFRIVDVDTVYVRAAVPEANAPQLRRLTGAEIEVPEMERRLRPSRTISIGRIVDPESRTLDVIYAVPNTERLLAMRQTVSLRLFTSNEVTAPAVPEDAVIDDGGRSVVFVQIGGESFERRPVRLGFRESGLVHVLQGVQPGERVVTEGAYLVRLAALSTQIPAHGHVH